MHSPYDTYFVWEQEERIFGYCCLRLLAGEGEIQRETDRLEELRCQEERKRAEVVEAKKETASLEKLREKKLDLYNKEAAKAEERFLEEFVSTTRANQSASA
jgi:flagellar FliJ protein